MSDVLEITEELKVGDEISVSTEPEAGPKKPKPRKNPKYEVQERPALGCIIHVMADLEIASRLNCEVGTVCAALVTNAGDGDTCFLVHIFSPTTNPDISRYVVWDTDGEKLWRWPSQA